MIIIVIKSSFPRNLISRGREYQYLFITYNPLINIAIKNIQVLKIDVEIPDNKFRNNNNVRITRISKINDANGRSFVCKEASECIDDLVMIICTPGNQKQMQNR